MKDKASAHSERKKTDHPGSLRGALLRLVEDKRFQSFIIGLIVFNGCIIIAETYAGGNHVLLAIDRVIIWLFAAEMLLKLYAYGFRRYFSGSWNVFDFLIVAGSLAFYTTSFVSAMRLLRVLRLLRMIPAIPALRKIVNALMNSIPALTGVLGMSILIFTIYAIIGTTYFSEVLPAEFFGSFHASLFTLMQVVTFESWASQVARPVIQVLPWAWVYFVSFIIIGALVILNLVVAVILSYLGQEEEDAHSEQMERLFRENAELKHEVQEVKQLLLDQLKRNG